MVFLKLKDANSFEYYMENLGGNTTGKLDKQVQSVYKQVNNKLETLKKEFLFELSDNHKKEFYFLAEQTSRENISVFYSKELTKLSHGICFNENIENGLLNFENVFSQDKKDAVLTRLFNVENFEKVKLQNTKEYQGVVAIIEKNEKELNIENVIGMTKIIEEYFMS